MNRREFLRRAGAVLAVAVTKPPVWLPGALQSPDETRSTPVIEPELAYGFEPAEQYKIHQAALAGFSAVRIDNLGNSSQAMRDRIEMFIARDAMIEEATGCYSQ